MAMDYVSSECGEKFNLGFGRPVSVPAMIDILKTELNVTARIVSLGRQTGNINLTNVLINPY